MTSNANERAEDILIFWFGAPPRVRGDLWFAKGDAFDKEVKDRFGEDLARAALGALDAWATTPRGCLALVILLDQFSRTCFRGQAGSFAQDAKARTFAEEAIARGDDRALHPLGRAFLYMPLMHAEDRAVQARSVGCFANLAKEAQGDFKKYLGEAHHYAEMHKKIVDRFGRFPHRNAVLGRPTTPEEEAFLNEPGSSF